MATTEIGGALFYEMLKSGAANLRNNAQTVNELNVFPIPDGDTGDNMSRTMDGGTSAAVGVENTSISAVASAVAQGMLLSARGNSGVILSQFFDGVSRGLDGKITASLDELRSAFGLGVKQAYSAVVQPTEGTILTVMREASEKADKASCDSFENYFSEYIEAMYASLENTPELLPLLKESGVVDSGGAGFAYIIEGMNGALNGRPEHDVGRALLETAATENVGFDENSEMKFGYCTEVIVQLTNKKTDVAKFDVAELTDKLTEMGGESIVAFKTGSKVKMHVHTFEPDRVIKYCLTVGELLAVKIENMSVQHTEAVVRNRFTRQTPKKTEHKRFGVVAVADGEGLKEQFISLGADYVVDGKQTMNPSASDFLAAFDAVDADTIFVLPNNANIVLTAKQAAEMYGKSRVVVIDSKTVAEGYSALSMLDMSSDNADIIAKTLADAVAGVETGSVTYAVRDSSVGGLKIKKDDYLGFIGKNIAVCDKTVVGASCALLDKIDKSDKSVVIAIRGKVGAEESDTEKIAYFMRERFPDMEFYDFYGGQDIYPFIFVVE